MICLRCGQEREPYEGVVEDGNFFCDSHRDRRPTCYELETMLTSRGYHGHVNEWRRHTVRRLRLTWVFMLAWLIVIWVIAIALVRDPTFFVMLLWVTLWAAYARGCLWFAQHFSELSRDPD